LLILSTWDVWYWFLQQGGWGPLRPHIPFKGRKEGEKEGERKGEREEEGRKGGSKEEIETEKEKKGKLVLTSTCHA
jgi:hypothetical protein